MAFPVDVLGPLGGCGGLFPQGEQILRRIEDIEGGLRFRRRLTVHLVLSQAADPAADCPGPHQRLLEFAAWARDHVPNLGEQTTLKTDGPQAISRDHRGLGRYRLKLVFEYTI